MIPFVGATLLRQVKAAFDDRGRTVVCVGVGMIRVLFVCLANVCPSPMAHAVFAHFVQEAGLSHRIAVDSAGLG